MIILGLILKSRSPDSDQNNKAENALNLSVQLTAIGCCTIDGQL
jgi:hypothetical protein